MQPIYDNLRFLTDSFYDDEDKLQYLFDSNVLDLEAVTYIRGRSLPRQFIIVDEAQNLTPHEVKTIITRAGEGTKIVFTGDVNQIDQPYLDSLSNGLSYPSAIGERVGLGAGFWGAGLTFAAERFKDHEIAGHVLLTRSERSPLAALASELL